jgi:hypothetical protein
MSVEDLVFRGLCLGFGVKSLQDRAQDFGFWIRVYRTGLGV